jgi:hypothetical protein
MGLELETKKSQLVFEICSLSALLVSCVHRHHSSSCDPVESHFIDWYRILGVRNVLIFLILITSQGFFMFYFNLIQCVLGLVRR